MLVIQNTLVSEELLDVQFVCDLQACKGACCVQGSSGAPLETEELGQLEEAYAAAKSYMRTEGIKAVEEMGLYQMDTDGDLVTTLVDENRECAYVQFENGIAKCAFEMAYNDGKTNWKKPISCHLYPVRLKNLHEYIAVNYHKWQVCAPACECGAKLKVPVYKFLQEALKIKFGENWYNELSNIDMERRTTFR